MIKTNYHIHSTYCDGHNTLEEMAQSAIDDNLESIGFTSHFYSPFDPDHNWSMRKEDLPVYLDNVDRIKEDVKDKLKVYKSFEIDYYMHLDDIIDEAKELRPQLDYMIGSIHTHGFLDSGELAAIDDTLESFTEGIRQNFNSTEHFIKSYYEKIGDMAESIQPEIIGHIDIIKKNNFGIFNENDEYYQKAVRQVLDRIQKTDCIIEVNTGGVYRFGEKCFYPSPFILKEIKKRNIPITVTGDTHFKDGMTFYYPQTEKLLKELGFFELYKLENSQWIPYKM